MRERGRLAGERPAARKRAAGPAASPSRPLTRRRVAPSFLPSIPKHSGLLLSPGGEFAFVLFGEAVSRGIMGAALAKELYLVVALRWVLGRAWWVLGRAWWVQARRLVGARRAPQPARPAARRRRAHLPRPPAAPPRLICLVRSMALTPFLAQFGAYMGQMLEKVGG